MENELRLTGIRIASNLAERNAVFLIQNETWELYQSVRGVVINVPQLEDSFASIKYAVILNKRERVAAHSNPKQHPLLTPFELKGKLLSGRYSENFEIRMERGPDEAEMYHIAAPIIMRGERIGTAVVGISEEELIIQVAKFRNTVILATLLLSFAAILLGHFLSRRILRPLARLSANMQNLPSKIIDGIEFHGPGMRDEISFFMDAYNTVIDRYDTKVNELKIEKEKLDAILNGIHGGMIVISRDFKVEWQNRIYTQWFGDRTGSQCYEGEELKCEVCTDCPAKEVFSKEGIASATMSKKLVNGEMKVFNNTAAPLHDGQGRIIGALELLVDITHQVQMEDEFKKREQLATLGQMAAGLAHEIRNPMGSLITALQIVTSEDGKGTGVQKKKLLDVIHRETKRLNAILTDFLSFTHGKELTRRKCDINVLADEIMDILLSQNSSQVKIVRNFQKDLPAISIDQDLIKQVIWNIALNSLEAMEEAGGELVIETGAENGHIFFKIKDSGKGMDENSIRNCFEPFFTLKKTGTGLGLAIAKRIVSQHKGEIVVQSTEGKGSEFHISLPYKSEG
jgi:signal transduction histidine kinase